MSHTMSGGERGGPGEQVVFSSFLWMRFSVCADFLVLQLVSPV